MNLEKCREKIDKINDEILKLFISRMEVTSQVADYKKENNLSVYQPDREREILDKIRKDAGKIWRTTQAFYFRILWHFHVHIRQIVMWKQI